MKVTILEIKHYQLKNILMKLDHTYILKDINNLKISDTYKTQLTIAINFILSRDNDKEHAMHGKSYNIEIMIKYKTVSFSQKEICYKLLRFLFFCINHVFFTCSFI